MYPYRLSTMAAVLAVMVFFAACGGSSNTAGHGGGHTASESTAAPVEGVSEIMVNAVDIDFQPETIEIAAGEPVNVTVVNDGRAMHDFTLEAADVHMNVEPGDRKTTSLTIDEPGRSEAECTVESHAEAGMTIDVVVADS